ncbi:hypothetical protein HN748_04080 [Candidatus Peregrinibacteria bacterium]|jgi:cytoskeletal protein CcmA (bactofilin family)|nr:hypothetical protein [Candidatus Peregrinibacteria bacterium]MBT7703388.1 hypothetical protein [Candidatus Peregrinibacteria bacterium]
MSLTRKFTAIFSLALLGSLIMATTAHALILQASDELFFDEYVTEDVYIAGGNVTIEQDIDGDLFVAGGDVTVNGIINGDLFVAGGNILINEEILDDVRVIGGAMTLNRNVGGDVILIGGTMDLAQDAEIAGDVISLSGRTNLYGTVNKSVRGILGRLVLGGTINGDLDVRVTEKLVMLNDAHVVGNVKYFAPEKIEDHGAVIDGEVSFNEILSSSDKVKEGVRGLLSSGSIVGKLWGYLSLLLIGGLFIGFFPNLLHRASTRIKTKAAKSFGIGFLVFILGGTVSVIAAFTVIGVQLAFIVMALLFVLGELGRVTAGYFIGTLIIRDKSKKGTQKKRVFLRHFGVLALGVLILKVISFVPVLGWIAGFVFFITGAGALFLALRTTYRELIKANSL